MSLLDLPNELLLSVADGLRSEESINAFALTNRRLYCLLDTFLYEYHAQTSNQGLFWAANHGLTNPLLKFLDVGANPRGRTTTGATALHLAAQKGSLLAVEILIQSGADVDAKTPGGTTPLCAAARSGHEQITRYLLDNGADHMQSIPIKARPNLLHVACYFGWVDMVCLDKGMGIEVKDKYLKTPLHYAVKFDEKNEVWHGNLTTVYFLLEKKAVKDCWDKSGQRPKDLAKRNPNSVIELLLQRTANSTLDEAIQLDQDMREQRKRKEAQEEEKLRKLHKLAVERATKLKAREAEKRAKEELLRREKESAEYQARAEREKHDGITKAYEHLAIQERWTKLRVTAEEKQARRGLKKSRKQNNRNQELRPASTEHQKVQNALQKTWSNLRAEAEERSRMSPHPASQLCSHSGLGLLRWKEKGPCHICQVTFKHNLFTCADCGFVACGQCKNAS